MPVDGRGCRRESRCRWRSGVDVAGRVSRSPTNLFRSGKCDWKQYKGGQTQPIWIARLSDSSIEKLPRENSNDKCPMWVGDKVYFLSDRNGPTELFRFVYDTKSKKGRQIVDNKGLDIKYASAGGGAIVYEQFGTIFTLDSGSKTPKKVEIRVSGDFPGSGPIRKASAQRIANAAISPTGARAVFEARGEICPHRRTRAIRET